MSTRSIIAVQQGDTWLGRFCHDDGYPTWQGKHLHAMVARDGFETVVDTVITQHAGWANLRSDFPRTRGVRLAKGTSYGDYEPGSPQYHAALLRHPMYAKCVGVEGYGVAAKTAPAKLAAAKPFDPSNVPWDVEWIWVLTRKDILVMKTRQIEGTRRAEGVPVGRLAYDEEASLERLYELECGKDLERCSHVASTHYPEAKDHDVSVDLWLNRREPRWHDLSTFVVDGEQVRTRGGRMGTLTDSCYNPLARPQDSAWWAYLSESRWVRTGHPVGDGWVLDLDAVVVTRDGEEVYPAGTTVGK